MQRRTLIATVGALLAAGCSDPENLDETATDRGTSSQSTNSESEAPTCTVENGTEQVSAIPIMFESVRPSDADIVLEATANARIQATIDQDPEDLLSSSPTEDDHVYLVPRLELHNPGDELVPLEDDWVTGTYETPDVTGEATDYFSDGVPDDVSIKSGGSVSIWEQLSVPASATQATVTVDPSAYDDLTVGVEFSCDESLSIGIPEADSK